MLYSRKAESTFRARGIQHKHGVGVACQRGCAVERLEVEDAHGRRVGGQGEVGGRLGGPNQAQVCDLINVPHQLPHQSQLAFLSFALQRQARVMSERDSSEQAT